MKKSLLISSLFVGAALLSQAAQAEVKVRAGVASSTYELGGDYVPAKSKYNPFTLGVTYAANNGMYVDLAYSGGTGTHDGWTRYGTPSESFKRSDIALIFGGSHLNQDNGIAATVYVGLKTGKTTLGANQAALIGPGPYTTFSAWTEETFETSGIVFGGGASFPIASGRAGSVGVNLGLGLMGNTWKDNSINGYNLKAKTALGGSVGVSYTFPITPMFGVVADYKYHSYSYKFDNAGGTPNPYTVRERISNLGLTAYAKF